MLPSLIIIFLIFVLFFSYFHRLAYTFIEEPRTRTLPVKPTEDLGATWSSSNINFGVVKNSETPSQYKHWESRIKQTAAEHAKQSDLRGLSVTTFAEQAKKLSQTLIPTSTRALSGKDLTIKDEASLCPKCIEKGKTCIKICPRAQQSTHGLNLSSAQEHESKSRSKIHFQDIPIQDQISIREIALNGCAKCRSKGLDCDKECPNRERKLMAPVSSHSVAFPSEEKINTIKPAGNISDMMVTGLCCKDTECAKGCPKRGENVGLAGETNLDRDLNMSRELEMPDRLKKWSTCLKGNCIKNCSRAAANAKTAGLNPDTVSAATKTLKGPSAVTGDESKMISVADSKKSGPCSKCSGATCAANCPHCDKKTAQTGNALSTMDSLEIIDSVCSKCSSAGKKCTKECPKRVLKENDNQLPQSQRQVAVAAESTDLLKSRCSKCSSLGKKCTSDCPGKDSKKVSISMKNEEHYPQSPRPAPVAAMSTDLLKSCCSKCSSIGKACTSDCPGKGSKKLGDTNVNKSKDKTENPTIAASTSADVLQNSCSKCSSAGKTCTSDCPGKNKKKTNKNVLLKNSEF